MSTFANLIETVVDMTAHREDGSLLQLSPWTNPWLVLACLGGLVRDILYFYVSRCGRVAFMSAAHATRMRHVKCNAAVLKTGACLLSSIRV